MKELRCDICGRAVTSGWDLTALKPEFRTESVEHVCNHCLSELNAHIKAVHDSLLQPLPVLARRFIAEYRRGLRDVGARPSFMPADGHERLN